MVALALAITIYIYVRGLLMEKIVIIGSSGAGKTTLARNLGSILKIKVFHLDRVLWRRDWEKIARERRIDILEKLVMDRQWIIEGTYPLSSESVLKAADTIIFLDMPFLLCLKRVFKRHREKHGRRRDLPDGSTDKLDLHLIWKVLTFRFKDKGTFQQMLDNRKPGQEVIQLYSSKEVKEFLAQQGYMEEEIRSSFSTSTLVSATPGT